MWYGEKCHTTLIEVIYYFIFASPSHFLSFQITIPFIASLLHPSILLQPSASPLLHPSSCFPPSLSPTVCPSDRGDVLWRGGGDGSGVHRYLPGAGEQRHGVQPAGASQQGHGHQHC